MPIKSSFKSIENTGRLSTPRGGSYTWAVMSRRSFPYIDSVIAGRARLSETQALELYQTAPLHDLGQWAQGAPQTRYLAWFAHGIRGPEIGPRSFDVARLSW